MSFNGPKFLITKFLMYYSFFYLKFTAAVGYGYRQNDKKARGQVPDIVK